MWTVTPRLPSCGCDLHASSRCSAPAAIASHTDPRSRKSSRPSRGLYPRAAHGSVARIELHVGPSNQRPAIHAEASFVRLMAMRSPGARGRRAARGVQVVLQVVHHVRRAIDHRAFRIVRANIDAEAGHFRQRSHRTRGTKSSRVCASGTIATSMRALAAGPASSTDCARTTAAARDPNATTGNGPSPTGSVSSELRSSEAYFAAMWRGRMRNGSFAPSVRNDAINGPRAPSAARRACRTAARTSRQHPPRPKFGTEVRGLRKASIVNPTSRDRTARLPSGRPDPVRDPPTIGRDAAVGPRWQRQRPVGTAHRGRPRGKIALSDRSSSQQTGCCGSCGASWVIPSTRSVPGDLSAGGRRDPRGSLRRQIARLGRGHLGFDLGGCSRATSPARSPGRRHTIVGKSATPNARAAFGRDERHALHRMVLHDPLTTPAVRPPSRRSRPPRERRRSAG